LKDIVIIGGPNGAGKTTAARALLPSKLDVLEFVNADEIARGLSPFNADHVAVAAGRLMIERVRSLLQMERSFAFETTCSGRGYVPLLKRCKAAGWRTTLIYLWLPSPEAALARVAQRVREGGHAIPPETVIRRYWAGIANMRNLYLPLADVAAIYNNSDEGRVLVAERTPEKAFIVHDSRQWSIIERAAP